LSGHKAPPTKAIEGVPACDGRRPSYRFAPSHMIPRLLFVALSAVSVALAAEPAKPLFKLKVQLDWIPEPEHGGLYQAQARGFFREEGLDVTLLPGGPNAFVMPLVATGKADIGQADSTNTLMQQAEGLPVVQFAAVFQDDPSGILVNADSPVHRFEDLQGKTIIARPEWVFLKFLQKKYGVSVNIVPQNFSVAAFLSNKEALQQGYFIAEPYHITHAGGKMPRFLSTWDAGFRAYAVLVTGRRFAREHPDELRAFVRAYIRGWQDYLEGDPSPAHAALKEANAHNTDDFMAFSRRMIIQEKLVTGRDSRGGPESIGRLLPERFATQIQQLEELGILRSGKVKTTDAITTAFLPK
jgi:NitT/TauT family transport system substrate-binding protein